MVRFPCSTCAWEEASQVFTFNSVELQKQKEDGPPGSINNKLRTKQERFTEYLFTAKVEAVNDIQKH